MQVRFISLEIQNEITNLKREIDQFISRVNLPALNIISQVLDNFLNEKITNKDLLSQLNPFRMISTKSIPEKFTFRISFIYHLLRKEMNEEKTFEKAESFFELGTMYAHGIGTSKNEEKSKTSYHAAIKLFKEIEKKQPNFKIWTCLGNIYQLGLGKNINFEEAIKWYKKFDEYSKSNDKNPNYKKEHLIAATGLGQIYFAQKKYKLALPQLMFAAESNSSDIYCSLGRLYEYGLGVEKNIKTACDWYDKAINKIDTPIHLEAALRRAEIYEKNQEYLSAIGLYQQIANVHKHPKAFGKLAKLCVKNDIGIIPNPELASQCVWWAMQAGDVDTLLDQAQLSLNSRDFNSARVYYESAITLQSSEAQFKYGQLLETGFDGPPNLKLAIPYYELAAKQNHVEALHRLGAINEDLYLRETNPTKQLEFFHKAHFFYKMVHDQCLLVINDKETPEVNLANIYFLLGWINQHGQGIDANLDKAISYYQEANKRYYPAAASQIKLINEQIKEQQILDKKKIKAEEKSIATQPNLTSKNTQKNKKRKKKNAKSKTETEKIDFKTIYDSLIATGQYDNAIQALKKLSHNETTPFLKANLLWSIAQCEKRKLEERKIKESDLTLQKQLKIIQVVYDEALQYISNILESLKSGTPEFIDFQSMKNLVEYEAQQLQSKNNDVISEENLEVAPHEHISQRMKPKKNVSDKEIKSATIEKPTLENIPPTSSIKPPAPIIPEVREIKITLDPEIQKILDTLAAANASHFIHGGLVRDDYLNRPARDVDIVTNLPPEEIVKLFPNNSKIIGERFKIVHITLSNGDVVEVTTFRLQSKDNIYGSLQTDSQVRDLTINSLYYDPAGKLLAFNNAISDLDNGIIRFINNPFENVQEDPARIIRAIRFASELGFKIEEDSPTENSKLAIQQNAYLLKEVHPSRLFRETKKLLQSPNAAKALQLMKDLNVFQFVFPQVTEYTRMFRDTAYQNMLNTLFQENQNEQTKLFNENYDLMIAALLSGPLKGYLFKFQPDRKIAMDKLLEDFEKTMRLSNADYYSIRNILESFLHFEFGKLYTYDPKSKALQDLYQSHENSNNFSAENNLDVGVAVQDKSEVSPNLLSKFSTFAVKPKLEAETHKIASNLEMNSAFK